MKPQAPKADSHQVASQTVASQLVASQPDASQSALGTGPAESGGPGGKEKEKNSDTGEQTERESPLRA